MPECRPIPCSPDVRNLASSKYRSWTSGDNLLMKISNLLLGIAFFGSLIATVLYLYSTSKLVCIEPPIPPREAAEVQTRGKRNYCSSGYLTYSIEGAVQSDTPEFEVSEIERTQWGESQQVRKVLKEQRDLSVLSYNRERFLRTVREVIISDVSYSHPELFHAQRKEDIVLFNEYFNKEDTAFDGTSYVCVPLHDSQCNKKGST